MNGYTSGTEDQWDDERHSSTLNDGRFNGLALEASKYVVGPMPVDDCLQRFLRSPALNRALPSISFENVESLSEVTTGELEMYAKLINAVQPFCSNFELRDVHYNPMYPFESLEIRPSLCIFNRGIKDIDLSDPNKPEIMITLKADTEDPFNDNGEYVTLDEEGMPKTEAYFIRETKAGRRTLGQITAHVAAQQAAQFRTHIFSILIFPKHARLFRWDRSGVVVTERFPLCSQYLMEFFHLYNHATPHVRGLDVSVSIPSENDASKARVALGGESTLPLVQLSLGSSSYIIPRKVYMNRDSPFGRSTRGFVAYSISLNENVFLKDSWRLDSQTPEHDVYARLRSSNVPHIPTVIDGGDILDHKTFTQELLEETLIWIRDPPRRLKKHRHYRLILKEIATPLRSFSSTKILVSAIHDAIKAHRAAYFDAGILHRDISSGNIMIFNNGGLLIDWDLSKRTGDSAQKSERTGTWQFISCRLLKDPNAPQDLTDDVESFIHVLTWVSFRYAKHNLTDEALNDFLTSVFDHSYYEKDGLARGGRVKAAHLVRPIDLMHSKFDNPVLKKLLLNITEAIAVKYHRAPSLKDTGGDEAALHHLLNVYKRRLEALKDSEWIINEFASVLKSPDWPVNDEARKCENTQTAQSTTHTKNQSSSLKRKNSEDAGGNGKRPRALILN